MAKFHITTPNGAEFEVEGPNDPHSAVAALKQAIGGGNASIIRMRLFGVDTNFR
jgi:hypothetical protein